ncbi:MAG: hypothetical protein IT572_09020 [Deltaproteobacteria bacterium]|nr:hypothetical protein [Deltaproteobacteria bacterium]
MSFGNTLKNTAWIAGLALASLGFIANSHAAKKIVGPYTAYAGAEVLLQSGLGAKEATRLSFSPDYSFTGGIEVPVERDMAAGEYVTLRNTRGGDKAETAELLVERSSQGGLLIRLINHEGFNYQTCTGGDEPPPGIAHGEGPGEICFEYGLLVALPGQFQGTLAKLSLDEGLKVASVHGEVSYRLAAENDTHDIEADEALLLRLPAGKSVKIAVEAAPAHKFLATDGKLLYHLAKVKKVGPALGQTAAVGELNFTAMFDVGPQGDNHFKLPLRAGDVVRVKGGAEGQDFAFSATEGNNGSLLKISRIAEDRPLKSVQVNDGDWITLAEGATVAITSSGGSAGYQSSGASQQFALPDGKTSVVQSGEVATIELFTTVQAGGMNFAPKPPKAGFDGPSDLAIPHFDPVPTDEPEATDAPQDGEDGANKGVVPGEGLSPSASGSGWAGCSLSAPAASIPGWDLAWLTLALPLLRRRNKNC